MGKPKDSSRQRQPRKGRGLLPLTRLERLTDSEEELRREKPRRTALEPLTGKTPRQNAYIAAIRGSTLTFGIGPAGVGKTFCAAGVAAELFAAGEIERIILTRPAVESGEQLGFMPGDLMEKYGHYLTPLREVLERRMGGQGVVEAMLKTGKIQAVPFAFMRGLTWDNSIVLADEMQNATPAQVKMLLTRIGEYTRVVCDGDPSQKDIPGPCGLLDAVAKLQGRSGVSVVRFTQDDVVRSGFAQLVVEAYSKPHAEEAEVEDPQAGLQRMLNI